MKHFAALALVALASLASPQVFAANGSAVGVYTMPLSLQCGKMVYVNGVATDYETCGSFSVTYNATWSRVRVEQIDARFDRITVDTNLVWTGVPMMPTHPWILFVGGFVPQTGLNQGTSNWSGNWAGLLYAAGDTISMDTNGLMGVPLAATANHPAKPDAWFFVTNSGTGHQAGNLFWTAVDPKPEGGVSGGRLRGQVVYESLDDDVATFINAGLANRTIKKQ
ncbi:MAG TPA: hypothetical protein VHU87_10290 [Rhizomicrobium sp.]|nr:hypothetical protein [Rhizomicrobium sp.]